MLSVASCSNESTIRKRRGDGESESPDIKVARENVYVVLEAESNDSSSDQDVDSVWSLQNKSTDIAKDTSDTSSKTSFVESEENLTGLEYEVASLSEKELPFNSCSSGPDSYPRVVWREEGCSEGGELTGFWADGSCAEQDGPESKLIPLRRRNCLRCKAETSLPQFCNQCYKIRKEFFPPRPKRFRRKMLKPKKKKPKDDAVNTPEQDMNKWLESCSSQDLSPGDLCANDGHQGICNICFKNPKNGVFLHNQWVHIYSCYQCSLKIWFSTKCCPLCNGKIRQVLKVAYG